MLPLHRSAAGTEPLPAAEADSFMRWLCSPAPPTVAFGAPGQAAIYSAAAVASPTHPDARGGAQDRDYLTAPEKQMLSNSPGEAAYPMFGESA